MVGATINPQVIRWARERAMLTREEAERGLKLKAKTLDTWEANANKVTAAQLEKLAKFFGVPSVAFFLDQVPAPSPIPDFRTPDRAQSGTTRYLLTLRDRTTAQQSEAKALLLDIAPAHKVALVGSLKITDSPAVAADKVRRALGLNSGDIHGKADNFFKVLRSKAEDAGVFVLLAKNLGTHHSNISESEFSGLALSDDVAPFVVIHADNSAGRRNFTLVHELAHLGLRSSALSAHDPFATVETPDLSQENKVEQYCDRVAAEVLLPRARLVQAWNLTSGDRPNRIEQLVPQFGASHSAVVVGLFRAGLLTAKERQSLLAHYQKLWDDQRRREKLKQAEKSGGPNPYDVKRNYLGKRLLDVVRDALGEKYISSTRAARVLGVNPMKLETLFDGRH